MGPPLRKQLMVIGILVVILSTIFATQYATTKVGYAYTIVHPSNADIRFIGSDNSSDGVRVLRVNGDNSSGQQLVTLKFGNWSARTNKTYTCAFGIVNEEQFGVNITHITVVNTGGPVNYMQIWLHGDRDRKAEDDATSVFMYNNGTAYYTASSTAWTLDAGNSDPSNMNSDGVSITTGWDQTAHVRYSNSNVDASTSHADFVWVQISLNIPSNVDASGAHTGTVEIHFQATTHWSPSSTTMTLGFGSPAVFGSESCLGMSMDTIDSSHVVIGYNDESAGTSVIGTISGNTIDNYGSSVDYDAMGTGPAVSVLDSTHFVIAYDDWGNSDYGTARIGTVSGGDSISYGSEAVFNLASTGAVYVASLDNTHFVVAYMDRGNSNYGTAIVGTVSGGNSISYGSEKVFNSAYTNPNLVASLDSTHFVVAYDDGGNSWAGTAIVGTVSGGNSISYGSEAVFNPDGGPYSIISLDNTHFVVAYGDAGNSDYGTAIVGTISGGNSISYGSEAVFNPGSTRYSIVASLDSTHVVIAYQDRGNSWYGTAIVGTISGGNSISYGSEVIFNSASTSSISVTSLDSTRFVVAYQDEGNSWYGTAIVGTYS